MTERERARHLKNAALLIGVVLRELNTDTTVCPSCGLKRHEHWAEYQMAQELEAVERKLTRFAKQLLENRQ